MIAAEAMPRSRLELKLESCAGASEQDRRCRLELTANRLPFETDQLDLLDDGWRHFHRECDGPATTGPATRDA